jgi:hypothetical protein
MAIMPVRSGSFPPSGVAIETLPATAPLFNMRRYRLRGVVYGDSKTCAPAAHTTPARSTPVTVPLAMLLDGSNPASRLLGQASGGGIATTSTGA